MKKTGSIFLLVTVALVWVSCSKLDIDKEAPDCIKFKIEERVKDSTLCDDAKVEEYTFQGSTCYLFSAGTCGADLTSDVFNFDCVKLGTLGGIAGITKINNEEFSNAVLVKTIWEK